MSNYHQHPSGVSLIIAIIFVSALMFVIASLAETTINSYKNIQNWQNFTRSQTAAETLAKEAKFLADQYDAGWNAVDSWESGELLPDPSTPLGFVLSSVLDNLKDMKGACAQGALGGALEPCGDISFRYDVIGSPAEPLSFPGITGDLGYPSIPADGCTFGRDNCHYVIPAPIFIDRDEDGVNDVIEGTGDLTEKCLDLDDDGDVDDTDKLNGDNPCHWNKLTLGKLIEIPLYYTASDGTIVNPGDIDPTTGQELTEFKLRIRTPCRNPDTDEYTPDQWCASNLRVQLYPENRSGISCDPDGLVIEISDSTCKIRTPEDDKQLVRWEIQFENLDDPSEPYSLLAMDDPVESYKVEPRFSDILRRKKNPADSPVNTELYASKITKEQFAVARGQDAIVLTNDDIGLDVNKYWDTIEKFYKDTAADFNLNITSPLPVCPNWNCIDRRINKPKLRLELIYRPRLSGAASLNTTSANVVPYLEYQILTNRSIGDEKKTIRTEARVSGTGSSTKTKVYNPVIQQSFVVEN